MCPPTRMIASNVKKPKVIRMHCSQPVILAMDLEGVLVPEVWIAVAERTGIDKLRLTTRDVSDYDALMRGRLALLRENGLGLPDIQGVIAGMQPLPGAADFVRRVRAIPNLQLIILSDTYYEFAAPLMARLDWPVLFCNSLETDSQGNIVDYHLRQPDGKRHAVNAFVGLNFFVIAVGDSYNDTAMLAEAQVGILFRPSDNVRREFPQFPVVDDYAPLEARIADALG